MDYTDPPRLPNAARALCRLLVKASADDAATLVAADLAAAFGSPAATFFSPRTDDIPAWGVWACGNWIYALAEGCSTLRHGILTASGYSGSPLIVNLTAENAYYRTIGQAIAAEIRTRPGYQTANIRFVGHSLGGAAVEAAALELKQEIEDRNAFVCTFGAPKFGSEHQCQSVSVIDHARWFNSDDPVPLVFPTAADNLTLMLGFTAAQLVRIGRFTHPRGGLELLPSGTIRAEDYPSDARVDAVANIGAWLLSIDRGSATPHDLDAYDQRLTLFINRGLPPSANPRPSTVIPPTVDTSRVNLTRRQSRVIREMQEQERQQNAARLTIPKKHLVRVERFNQLHRVMWGDQVLSICTRRRTALRIKNMANGFLEAMLRMGIVDPQTVIHQLQAYLDAASGGDSAISPQLKTTLPSDE